MQLCSAGCFQYLKIFLEMQRWHLLAVLCQAISGHRGCTGFDLGPGTGHQGEAEICWNKRSCRSWRKINECVHWWNISFQFFNGSDMVLTCAIIEFASTCLDLRVLFAKPALHFTRLRMSTFWVLKEKFVVLDNLNTQEAMFVLLNSTWQFPHKL